MAVGRIKWVCWANCKTGFKRMLDIMRYSSTSPNFQSFWSFITLIEKFTWKWNWGLWIGRWGMGVGRGDGLWLGLKKAQLPNNEQVRTKVLWGNFLAHIQYLEHKENDHTCSWIASLIFIRPEPCARHGLQQPGWALGHVQQDITTDRQHLRQGPWARAPATWTSLSLNRISHPTGHFKALQQPAPPLALQQYQTEE